MGNNIYIIYSGKKSTQGSAASALNLNKTGLSK